MGIVAESKPTTAWLRRVVIGRNPKRTLARIVVWVAVCFLVSKFVLLPIRVEGVSMLPTYKTSGVNFVNRLAYALHPPQRGDVVAIKMAGEHVMYLKRIIAMPGESLAFRNGKAIVNGKVLNEPYVKYPCNWNLPPEQIGWDEYYVVGDNRSMDFHEHTQGRAWRTQILGKLLL